MRSATLSKSEASLLSVPSGDTADDERLLNGELYGREGG